MAPNMAPVNSYPEGIYGIFRERPDLLAPFQDDEDAIVVHASDAAIVYSDGFTIRRPLQPTIITQDAMEHLIRYLDRASGHTLSYLPPLGPTVSGEQRLTMLLGQALVLWENDLSHRFQEMPPSRKGRTWPEALLQATRYAVAHRNVPLLDVAEQFHVAYLKLVAAVRSPSIPNK